MLTLPIPLLLSLLLGLLSLAFLGAGIYLLNKATRRISVQKHKLQREHPHIDDRKGTSPGKDSVDASTWWRDPHVRYPLLAGALLLLFTLGGGYLIRLVFPVGQDEPKQLRGEPKTLARADGTKIHAELFGSRDRPILVFTHGWGTSSTEWYYAKKHLSDRYRLIVWDLPGLGESCCSRRMSFSASTTNGLRQNVTPLIGLSRTFGR